jgi:hypothetical protein
MPYAMINGVADPRCHSTYAIKCIDTAGFPDGRAYNIPVIISGSEQPITLRGSTPFQYASNPGARNTGGGTVPVGAFYRIHSLHRAAGNVPDPANGVTGLCTMNDASAQVGCLVDADPCTIGLGRRRGAALFPSNTPLNPPLAPLKALAIDGVAPFSGGADADLPLEGLITGAAPIYPMSHRVYLNTVYGFANLVGGEAALSTCFADPTIMSLANAASGIVSIPPTASHPAGGPRCIDYPEDHGADVPPANTPGDDNQALGGCGIGLTNVNACP